MSGEKQNALAASVGALEIFKAVIDNDAGDILAGVAGKEANLRQLASQGNELAANQAAAFMLRLLGKG